MPRSNQLKLRPQQLLVEGNSDKRVIEALCEQQLLDLFSFTFPTKGGIENLLENLPRNLNEPNLKTLGVVVDADFNLDARWQAVTDRLKKYGYEDIPKILPEMGWIHVQNKKPKIGVWIMPDNKFPGMLEDFVRYLIPEDDKLRNRVIELLDEIEREELNPYSLTHRPKALIHSWLALQKTPGIPMGQAITEKALSRDSETANLFIDWLNNLFELNG